ncbi:hypothetical protein BP6252_02932 [Coleophoma cylindrospora]|uniref:C2H2-type domain-containing protein n=1 Tax=Coleophoma cylindrospora TaxID=1849047 RepID=A0A3D8S6I9_9HELO|nr:hypothetical protein BP6252_02932 [Coleophoma cylindrospora]
MELHHLERHVVCWWWSWEATNEAASFGAARRFLLGATPADAILFSASGDGRFTKELISDKSGRDCKGEKAAMMCVLHCGRLHIMRDPTHAKEQSHLRGQSRISPRRKKALLPILMHIPAAECHNTDAERSFEPYSTSSMVPAATTSPANPRPDELWEYLPDYRVVICVTCRYAVQPNAISRHLKEVHHIQRSHRRPFMQYVSRFRLDQPQDVVQAKIRGFPVPILPVLDGLQCKHEGCFHLCASVKRMRTHWTSEHGRSGRAIFDWHSVLLQTFFKGNLLRYFTNPSASCPWDPKLCLVDPKINFIEQERYLNAITLKIIPSPDKAQRFADLDETDTALLDHYIASTSLTLTTEDIPRTLWDSTALDLACQHPFLLHGILACAALHLAYCDPVHQSEYTIRARSHQDGAMPIFRSSITNVNKDNCDAVFLFSHILVIYSFASERLDDHLLLVQPDESAVLPSWLYFLRSGCSLLCNVWETLDSGSVKALVSAWEIPITASEDYQMHPLDTFLEAIPPPTSEDAWSEEICQIYRESAAELTWAFSCMRALGELLTFWDALRVWPMRSWASGSVGTFLSLLHYTPQTGITLVFQRPSHKAAIHCCVPSGPKVA